MSGQNVAGQADELGRLLEPLRAGAWMIATLAGVGAAAAVIYRGRESAPVLLMALFLGWVVSPYVALVWVNRATRRWPPLARVLVYCSACLTSIGGLIAYGYAAFGAERVASTGLFLMVPAGCWLLVGGALLFGWRWARG